ncbi:MAG: YqgE/AlgH family protein [Gammaproteobacteria bacterium]|nr:YqgE/AlgH family protein [Gammaproteobacteria bacterium]
MIESGSLRNHFLIAMPTLADPNFFHSVIYICQHNDEGALGIVINRPLNLNFGYLLEQLSIRPASADIAGRPVYLGGPVQSGALFILHQPPLQWESSLPVDDEISLTTSPDILNALAQDAFPGAALAALGYAGWAPGQLEQELLDNAWLSVQADPHILFHAPVEQRWSLAAASLGVDVTHLSGDVGHA